MNQRSAVAAIQKHGILLVYPLDNKKEPPSLWSHLFPRTPMRWEWSSDGDDRVARLWQLREELSRSGKVVYAKWYRGRATFFSREVFTLLLSVLGTSRNPRADLSKDSRQVLELLEMESSQSTKAIKRGTDLVGRALERDYERAMKTLWLRLQIVGFGEIDDGAFPSLAIGATQVLFEDLWKDSLKISAEQAATRLGSEFNICPLFLKIKSTAPRTSP